MSSPAGALRAGFFSPIISQRHANEKRDTLLLGALTCLLIDLRPVATIALLSALQIFSMSIQVRRPTPRNQKEDQWRTIL